MNTYDKKIDSSRDHLVVTKLFPSASRGPFTRTDVHYRFINRGDILLKDGKRMHRFILYRLENKRQHK